MNFNKFLNSFIAAAIYLMVWNLFDFPSGVIKFGFESGEKVKDYNHRNDFMLRVAKMVKKNPQKLQVLITRFNWSLYALRLLGNQLECQFLFKLLDYLTKMNLFWGEWRNFLVYLEFLILNSIEYRIDFILSKNW